MDLLSRTLMGLGCHDCDFIPKVADAGRILQQDGQAVQVMHNGVLVAAGGYYGDWMAHLIRGLSGHHEPQEEALFHEVVRRSRNGSLFVELGCFWAYYTNWFLTAVPGSTAFCVEPDPSFLAVGMRNLRLNKVADRARILEAWIGGHGGTAALIPETWATPRELPMINADALLELSAGVQIEVLHIDAQGAETSFLRSLTNVSQRIRFAVVSTHHESISGSPDTHRECLDALLSAGAYILAEHSVEESFSGDGLIVASFFPHDAGAAMPRITKNSKEHSLFGAAW